MARRKIWVLHLTSDPLGQLIFSESYKEFTKFMNEEVEFKEIIQFLTVGYDYVYTYKNQEVSIFIPVFHADIKDYCYALVGYRAGYKESEHVQGYIASGLEYKEVAEKLQDWLINEKWKKQE